MKKLAFFLLLGGFLFACSPDNPVVPNTDDGDENVDPTLPENPEGYDLREYPYKLNVIYFVASDRAVNPNYETRLSKLLLEFQKFTATWMEHWGYGFRSFGLPKTEAGLVEIVVVNGAEPISGYPYDSNPDTEALESGPVVDKIKAEVAAHYAANGLTPKSDHYMVIFAGSKTTSVPYYGTGRWAFALDYPGMSQELLATDGNAYVGGLMHEMMHGINLPHVGSSYSQKSDGKFGTTLMGFGNSTYGKQPTFFHETSAAWLNNSQVAALAEGTFYDTPNDAIAQPKVVIDGGSCTVSGTFTSNKTVNGVVVRFTNSTEADFLARGSSGYSSYAKVTKPNGNSYSVTIPINELRGIGATSLRMGIHILHTNGTDRGLVPAPVYQLVNSGGTYTLTTQAVDRSDWTVSASHALPAPSNSNGDTSNTLSNLVDGNPNSCLTLVKPGATYKEITVGAEEKVWATIDLGRRATFNTVLLDFRQYVTHQTWRAKTVSFHQSDDGVNFTLIKQATLDAATPQTIRNTISLGGSVTTRYLRMTYDEWDASAGNDGGAMMFSELYLENR